MPQNWEEAKFEDKIIGCFTALKGTSFSLNNFESEEVFINGNDNQKVSEEKGNKTKLSDCVKGRNYKALVNGNCYEFDKIPLFLKTKLSQCDNKVLQKMMMED